MNEKKYQNYCAGTYTIEAALVFPIIFLIILFLLNYAFYHYDKSKLQSEVADIVRKASVYMNYEVGMEDNQVDRIAVIKKSALSIFFEERQRKEMALKQYIVNRLRRGYYVMTVDDIDVSSTFSKVRVTGNLKIKFYGYRWINRFFKNRFTLVFDQSAKTFPREETARLLDVAISMGSQIKGVEDTVNELAKLIGYIH
ncbi:MAG: TadE/TadG family type IV pilus assembly protein [Clostridiales bacterium]|nr:TadE/TadG family type IV pilus assembly protein [Clostridiales bacterium]